MWPNDKELRCYKETGVAARCRTMLNLQIFPYVIASSAIILSQINWLDVAVVVNMCI